MELHHSPPHGVRPGPWTLLPALIVGAVAGCGAAGAGDTVRLLEVYDADTLRVERADGIRPPIPTS